MSDMVSVQRANVVLRIKESEAERYLAKGYNILDENGNVAKHALPGTFGELQVAYAEHIRQIEELQAQVDQLTAEVAAKQEEIEKLKTAAKKSTKKKTEE